MSSLKTVLGFAGALTISCGLSTAATAAIIDLTTTQPDGTYENFVISDPLFNATATAGLYVLDGAIFLPDVDGITLPLPVGTVGDLAVRKTSDGLGVVLAGLPNLGTDLNGAIDLITFTFDRPMYFNSALFSRVDGNDDVDVFIDGVLVPPSDRNISAQNPVPLGGFVGTSLSFGADDLGFGFFGSTDDFKVAELNVNPVPLPAGGLLLLGGLGAAAALRGRRKA